MDDEVRRAGDLLDAGRPDEAAGVLRGVLRRDDSDAAAWLLLSEARRRGASPGAGDREAAVQAARRAAALVPGSAAPRCALARALVMPRPGAPRGDPDAALAAAREAVAVDDHSVEALLLLADLLQPGSDAPGGAGPDEPARLRERAARLDPERTAASRDDAAPPAGAARSGAERSGAERSGAAATARLLVRRITWGVVLPGLAVALVLLAVGGATGRATPVAVVVAALEVVAALAVVVLTLRGRPGASGAVWGHLGSRAVLVEVVLVVLLTLVAAVTVVPPTLLALSVVALVAGVAVGVLAVRPRR